MIDEAQVDDNEEVGVEVEEGDGFVVDYANTKEDAGFEPLPRGIYDVEFSQVDFAMSKSANNPMWAIRLKVIGETELAGRIIFTQIVFSEKMAGRNKKMFNRLGLTALANAPFNPKSEAVMAELLAIECRVKIDIEKGKGEYVGRDRNNVKDFLPKASTADAFLGSEEAAE